MLLIARIRCVLINAQIYTDAGCDLAVFTLRTKPDFQMARHHHLVCHYLEMLVSGEIRRLMILMPPRHGKSELVSRRLPAYFLGRFPDANIIACSYGAPAYRTGTEPGLPADHRRARLPQHFPGRWAVRA